MATSATSEQPAIYHMPVQYTDKLDVEKNSPSMIASTMPVSGGPLCVTSGADKEQRLKKKTSIFGLGIAEILMGVFSVVLTIIALSITNREQLEYSQYASYRVRNPFPYSSPGIWGGVFAIVAGSLGVRIKCDPSTCMYIANVTMAIITACVTFSAAFVSGFSTGLSYYSPVLIVIHLIITLLNLASMIVAITHAAFSGAVLCFNKKSRATQPAVYVPSESGASYPQQPTYVPCPNGNVTTQQLQTLPEQGYLQSSNATQVINHGYQGNNSTDQMAQPPSYDYLYEHAVQTETKSPVVFNS